MLHQRLDERGRLVALRPRIGDSPLPALDLGNVEQHIRKLAPGPGQRLGREGVQQLLEDAPRLFKLLKGLSHPAHSQKKPAD